MDDTIYGNNFIAEENINPNGRPAEDKSEERNEDIAERTDLDYKDEKMKSAQKRKKLIKEADKVIKEGLK